MTESRFGFFFFQAEDGIRDLTVTGVQTCALPILQEGAAQLVALASAANRYVEETAPYKLAKEPARAAELDSVLANLARTVGRLAVLAQPFVPTTAETVWGTLGPSPSQPLASIRLPGLGQLDLAGRHILKPPILFPKPRPAPAEGPGE